MMIPITRKEKYINEIVGGGDTAPKTPQTREEFFFAAILGEVIAPSPVTRVEKYLSAIAGQYGGDLPTPITRIEYFLAKAAGMDVTIPTPITREEIFWSNYSAIVDFEVEGVPPLTYKAIEGTLENYRIYGNTVNGENVGDLITEGEHAGEYSVPVTVTNGTNTETTNIYLPEPIKMVGDEAEYIDYKEQKQHRVRKNLLPNNGTSYTATVITATKNDDGSVTISNHGEERVQVTWTYYNSDDVLFKAGTQIIISTRYTAGISFRYSDNTWSGSISQNQVYTIPEDVIMAYSQFYINADEMHTLYPMIRKADISDDTYEPYIANTDVDVTLPALPTLKGTNVLSVGTAVQPSKVYVKYKGERQ